MTIKLWESTSDLKDNKMLAYLLKIHSDRLLPIYGFHPQQVSMHKYLRFHEAVTCTSVKPDVSLDLCLRI